MSTRPTKDELSALGHEMMAALAFAREKTPGLELAISYGVQVGDTMSVAIVTTIGDPKDLVVLLVHNARDVKEKLIDPFEGAQPQ